MSGVKIVNDRSSSAVETTVVGSLDEVFEEIRTILRDYHPAGYGTLVQRIHYDGMGNYEARIWRATSCD